VCRSGGNYVSYVWVLSHHCLYRNVWNLVMLFVVLSNVIVIVSSLVGPRYHAKLFGQRTFRIKTPCYLIRACDRPAAVPTISRSFAYLSVLSLSSSIFFFFWYSLGLGFLCGFIWISTLPFLLVLFLGSQLHVFPLTHTHSFIHLMALISFIRPNPNRTHEIPSTIIITMLT
jgi:hypothetical protein